MIKINKFKNIFGISELHGANDLKRINVIYAPNGTAKTSICDALANIAEGLPCQDIIDESKISDYEINEDGNIINTGSALTTNIITYSGTKGFDMPINNVKLVDLVVSNAVKTNIGLSIGKIDSEVTNIQNILKSVFGSDYGKKAYIDSVQFLAKSCNEDNEMIIDLAHFLSDLKPITLAEKVDTKSFMSLSNSKALSIEQSENIKKSSKKYFEIVNKKFTDDIFDETFTFQNLKDVFDSALQNNFFDNGGKRLFTINKKTYTKEDIEILLSTKEKEIFDSEEGREAFNAVKKELNKNKSTASIASIVSKSPEFISNLLDYHLLIASIFCKLIGDANLKTIIASYKNIVSEQTKIEKILNEKVDDNLINEIWERFKSEFSFNKFDLVIENKKDSYLGTDVPKFIKVYKGTEIAIDNPEHMRFSTGEIRSFNFINFIIDVESKILEGKSVTVVLDDCAESFDYKNKYGIIDYICSISKNNNVQIISLTHNFDFYRSLILALNDTGIGEYFAYKNKDTNEVTFYDSKKGYYHSFAHFNGWKTNPTLCQLFGLIGFSRSVLQFVKGTGNDPDVKKIDRYLHFDFGVTDLLTMADLKNDLNPVSINISSAVANTDLFLKKIDFERARLCSSIINETDLEYKLTLGLYLRLFFERYLILHYKTTNGVLPTLDPHHRASDLLSSCKNILSKSDYNMFVEINTVCPSYIHWNSFMYEPLIDVDSRKLVECCDWLAAKNGIFPL